LPTPTALARLATEALRIFEVGGNCNDFLLLGTWP
jgi:hypothetical protein